jgi:hypothetical protein
MASSAQAFIFNSLSLLTTEIAFPDQKIAILASSCKEITFLRDSTGIYLAIMAIHTVS